MRACAYNLFARICVPFSVLRWQPSSRAPLFAIFVASVAIPAAVGQVPAATPEKSAGTQPAQNPDQQQTQPTQQPTQPQPNEQQPTQPPPTAPQPQLPAIVPQPLKPALTAVISAEGCLVRNTGATMATTAAVRAIAVSGLDAVPPNAGSSAVGTTLCVPHAPIIDWYARFLNGPEVKQLSPKQKAYLAVHNLLDPFNLLTITGEAAIAIAADSHSAYGPGVPGWGRYTGVSFTQDLTGEFFGTFLIPSIVHQDPHYHREPKATVKHRIAHAALQVLWTQSDNGRGMINYANLVGFAIDDEIGNLYVPGQRTDAASTASRYAIGLATAPIDNYVTEFVPDLARHIHIQIVVIQRIINQVARTDSTATP
jgi:hypothetical protein